MKLRPRLALTTVAVAAPLLAALAWVNVSARRSERRERMVQEALSKMQSGGGRERCEAAPERWSEGVMPGPPHHRGPGDGFGEGEHHGPPPGPPPEPPWERGGPELRAPPGPPPPGSPGEPGAPPEEPGHPGGRGHHGPHGPPGAPARLYAYAADLTSQNPAAPALPEELRVGASPVEVTALPARGDSLRLLLRMPWATGPCAYVLLDAPGGPHEELLPPTELWLVPMAAVLLGLIVSVGPLVQRVTRLTREVRTSAAAQYGAELSVTGSDEITELARAFSEAQRAIRVQQELQEQREAALRDFLANTTHDVMIPLTALQGHLAALSTQAGRPADPAELTAAADEAHYIASLVHNLALAAKLRSGGPALHREPVDLNALVARAAGRHQTIARQHQVAVEHGVPPEPVLAEGDVTMLEQAVSNVIANAVVYNRPGGHVAALLEAQPERFTLRVLDDGPGLSDADLARIQERGYRTDEARSRAPSGQGLGLSITTEVARRHGWTLELKRSEFGGLEVVFAGPRFRKA